MTAFASNRALIQEGLVLLLLKTLLDKRGGLFNKQCVILGTVIFNEVKEMVRRR